MGWMDARAKPALLRCRSSTTTLFMVAPAGSPVLDIKPYVPFCDSVPAATAPHWVAMRVGATATCYSGFCAWEAVWPVQVSQGAGRTRRQADGLL